ncbi:hypothetical protein [Sinorhizobium meliloti]|uniref:hypothetical protein n=1 Tax=Rhizobium meliloti TaxID=382 RepID=UPI0001E4B06A|nr:hypothetical protein [Sinorhizobium meliloti]AEG54034.1 hypothetical protein Sinme_2315 [Sinorhizobium meliloti AK83]MDE4590247.1 hypothetical protein [Sinorhizobium meliloti]SEI68675.1 electron transport complex protein RnfC [Sinorhizobium meliloti]
MTTPNLTSPEAYNAEIIANAVKFTASLFLGRGEYATIEATSREEIDQLAEMLSTEHPTVKSKPVITAFDAAGNQAVISGQPAKAPKAEKPAKEKPAKAAKEPAADKALGKRAQIAADAEAGILPAAPDFSAPTHARFRKKLAEIVALVDKADIKALKAYPINPVSSSPKAMDKYRNLAVIALEAQRKAAKAKAKTEESTPEAGQ